jgi:hypothetical protein
MKKQTTFQPFKLWQAFAEKLVDLFPVFRLADFAAVNRNVTDLTRFEGWLSANIARLRFHVLLFFLSRRLFRRFQWRQRFSLTFQHFLLCLFIFCFKAFLFNICL